MTKIQTWAMVGLATIVLAVGALLVSGAVTSAQTATPVPSSSQSDGTPTPHDPGNCPNMGTNSGGTMHYGPRGSNSSTGFHGHRHSATTVSNNSGT